MKCESLFFGGQKQETQFFKMSPADYGNKVVKVNMPNVQAMVTAERGLWRCSNFMIFVFYVLSSLRSYRDDGKAKRKSCVQRSAVQSGAEFCLLRESNSGPHNLELGMLTAVMT